MAQRTLNWVIKEVGVNDTALEHLRGLVPYRLPINFIKLMRESDGGTTLERNFFYKNNSLGLRRSSVGCFLSIGPSDDSLLDAFKNPPEFFPSKVLPFAVTGNGNYICFDYREDSSTDNPTIIYWDHEEPEGKDISFIAKNFDDFINMLYVVKDYEE